MSTSRSQTGSSRNARSSSTVTATQTNTGTDAGGAASDAGITLNPLYNKSYSTVRLTPLYHGSEKLLSNATLQTHARRLRNQLRGEILRGVRVEDHGHGDEDLGRAGRLLDVRWVLLAANISPFDESEVADESNPLRGTFIELVYERITYTAMMLATPEGASSSPDGFTSLPLLLTRMPPTLRTQLLKYLTTTFDCHATTLTPSSSFIAATLETYLSHLPNIVTRDIVLTFSFPIPASPSLKSMTVTIPSSDVSRFASRGSDLVSAQLSSPPPEESTKSLKRKRPARTAPSNSPFPGPFMTAVSYYTTSHLAIPISHPDIQLTRIACAGYMLGSEGRIKIFAPVAPPSKRKAKSQPSQSNGQDDNDAEMEEAAYAIMELVDALSLHAADPNKGNLDDASSSLHGSAAPSVSAVSNEQERQRENGDGDEEEAQDEARPAKRK